MSRLELEKQYWDQNALDEDVDMKYICDVPVELCLRDLGKLKGKVLEIGCGVGRLMHDGYYGIDISQNMIRIARQRKPKGHYKLCNNDIPYPDNKFDNVFCYLVIQHLKPDVVKNYIVEASRVLKPSGKFTFQFIEGTEREPMSNHYSLTEIKKMLRSAEFKEIHFEPSRAHELWTIGRAYK